MTLSLFDIRNTTEKMLPITNPLQKIIATIIPASYCEILIILGNGTINIDSDDIK